jgi:hypothetical protein
MRICFWSLAILTSLVAACGDGFDGRDMPPDASVPTGCAAASDCDDNDPCTVDTCDSTHACAHAAKEVDDAIDCTVDACDPTTGEVTHTTMNSLCSDDAECSTDVCDATAGCVHGADATACDSNATCSSSFDCECNSGYSGDGLTCSADVVTCDALTDPTNGSVSTSNGTATYACNSGFELTSSATRTCNMDGTWSGTAPTCRAITFFVVRVGDGQAALDNSSTAVFLDERDVDGNVVNTIALPTAASGNNAPFTLQGTATAEGGLSRSADSRYLTLGGYAIAPGTASINGTSNLSTDASPTNRVVARVSADGTIDTTTRLVNAFSGSSIRGVTSNDGTAFWASGNSGSGSTGGVHYVTLGSTGETVRMSGPNNLRHTHIYDGQLYISSAAGTGTHGVLAVGTGLPTTTGQTATQVAPFPNTLSANSFAVLDLNPVVLGPDTIYIAFDQGGVAGTANIQKWTFDGTTWAQASFAPTLTSTSAPNAIGLTTWVEGSNVTIILSTSETPSRLVKIVDDGATAAPAATVLDTAATNTAFRGVARAPLP